MIYTITSISMDDEYIRSTRCFGFFDTLEKAVKAVEINQCDMEECYYDWIVIEEFSEGIHPRATKEIWYVWNKTEQKWKPCERNKDFFGPLINFALG